MQLEQQESFEIKGPQLEVFGEAETRLPAAAKKRPAALAVLAVAIVASVLGIGGAQLKGQLLRLQQRRVAQVAQFLGRTGQQRVGLGFAVVDKHSLAQAQGGIGT